MKRFLAVIGTVLSLAAGQAYADVVFTFSGVTFDDGGSLTGTFTTNDTFNALLDFDITTSPGTGIGFHYTPGTVGSGSTSLPAIIVLSDATLDHILQVTFDGGLTAGGALIFIGTNDSFEQSTAPARREITGGSVTVATTVPEPSTLILIGVGVLALLLSLRRQRV